MKRDRSLYDIAFAIFLYSIITATSAWAQVAEKATISSVNNLLQGMGYESEPFSSNGLLIKYERRKMVFLISQDGETLDVFEQFDVPSNERNKLPLLKFLTYNDTHVTYISLEVDKNNVVTHVTINQTTSVRNISAFALKKIMENIKDFVNNPQSIIYSTNW